MATLPNPFGPVSPIGASMGDLMRTLFSTTGGVDPTRQLYNRAAAAKLQAETDAARNKASGMSSLGNMVQGIVSGPTPEEARPAPEFVGPMPAMSRGEFLTSKVGDINAAGLRAGLNPTQIGQLVFQTARQANLPAEEVARFSPDLLPLDKGVTMADRDTLIAQQNAAAKDKAVAVAQASPVKIGEGDIALFGPNDPRGSGRVEGLPTLNTERGTVAHEARETGEISPIGRMILGGSPGTPRNYATPDGGQGITLDGTTDAQSGVPIPQGSTVFTGQLQAGNRGDLTGKTASQVQGDTLAAKRFRALLSQTRDMAQRDPNNFGIPGAIKGGAQDLATLGKGLATGLGYNGIDEALTDVQAKAARSGVSPELISGVFDPNLPALQTLSDLLVYSAAETLAGQEGRSVSDRDVKLFKQIAGDPQSWLMSQQKYLAKLKIMEDVINGRTQATNEFVRERGGKATPQTQPSAQGAPQPGAVEDGYRFKGGNPADPNSWEKVQ